jgi:HSP20 family protein
MAEKESRALSVFDPFLDAWSPMRLSRLFEGWPGEAMRATRFVPAVDVTEDDDKYIISVEVPGAGKDDVSLEVHDNVLTIRGEKRSEREEKKEHARYIERSYGSFSRSFTLPSNADEARVVASFKDGVLTVEIAKREEAKPKQISIK